MLSGGESPPVAQGPESLYCSRMFCMAASLSSTTLRVFATSSISCDASLRLEPIILANLPAAGDTIIEKLERTWEITAILGMLRSLDAR